MIKNFKWQGACEYGVCRKEIFMKKIISACLAACLVLGMCACTRSAQTQEAQTAPPAETSSETTTRPAWQWQKSSPDAQGLDPDALEEVHRTFDSFPLLTSVIVKNGYIVDEYYKDGYDAQSVFVLNSASKSVTSALIGIALEQGLIESVDTPIAAYLPRVRELADERWQQITVRHLLTHTSGIQTTDDSLWYAWRDSPNWLEYIYALPIVADPGTSFSYSTGNTHLLCAVLQAVAGETADAFAQKYLFGPVGMESASIAADAQGISDGGNGVQMNVYDMARFGLLFLNGGVWEDAQVVPARWVQDSTSVQFARDSGSADYGYQWWVRTFGDADYDAYFAQGHGGQYIFVVPQLELVIAFTSNYEGRTTIYWNLVNAIVNACV